RLALSRNMRHAADRGETMAETSNVNPVQEPQTNGTTPHPALIPQPPVEPERRYAQIIGWGYAVPDKVITNHDLEQIVDTSDAWIRTRTGIEARRVATAPTETSASLGIQAARRALE